MTAALLASPGPATRLIPSKYPPIGLFDTVATVADAEAAMELAGWTNDRLLRLGRLPPAEWVFGRPNATIVMAAFLHPSPEGARFNGPELGAWYAAPALPTAAFEVAHHLRREAQDRGVAELARTYRAYHARLEGDFTDIRGRQAELPSVYDPLSHAGGQAFGEAVRAAGGAGIAYDSLRHAGGTCLVAYRPPLIREVVQAEHFRLSVRAGSRRIELRRLGTEAAAALSPPSRRTPG